MAVRQETMWHNFRSAPVQFFKIIGDKLFLENGEFGEAVQTLFNTDCITVWGPKDQVADSGQATISAGYEADARTLLVKTGLSDHSPKS